MVSKESRIQERSDLIFISEIVDQILFKWNIEI